MKKSLIVLIAILVMIMTGCSVVCNNPSEKQTVSFSESKSETKTALNETASVSVKTTAKQTATVKQTTKAQRTAKLSTAKPSITQEVTSKAKKVVTTKKQTTTKETTTQAYFCDEGGTHHSCDAGPIGWVDSYSKATEKALEYIADHDTSGNFTVEECWYCDKYTATVILD